MKYVLALLLLMGMPGRTLADSGDKGSLYVLVDHSAVLFINGISIKIPKSRAAPKAIPVLLHAGDRIVAKLSSTESKGDGYFMLLYVSPDKKAMISFRAVSFKILPDLETTDFPANQFGSFQEGAIARFDSDKMQRLFPYKNICQGFWGDRAESTVGTVITDDMFSPMLLQ
jgi:hypothetical protein